MPEQTSAIVVFVTVGSAAEAHRIADALIEKRLAACVQLLPEMLSVYRWQGAVRHDAEYLLLIKTVAARFEELSDAIRQLHSYETPEIIALPVTRGFAPYLSWVLNQTA